MNQTLVQSTFDLQTYRQRISHTNHPAPDGQTLAELHTAHTLAIPFENLDIPLARPIRIDSASVFSKLVLSHRGGYCFEMNTLFYDALTAIGFSVSMLQARVWYKGPAPSPRPAVIPMRGHKILLVTLSDGEQWLADVGFGGPGLVEPLRLEVDRLQHQPAGTYRLIETPGFGLMLQRQTSEGWENLYSFDLDCCFAEDYTAPNYYISTSPDSFFTQRLVCAQPTPGGGRNILQDADLTLVFPDGRLESRRITSIDDYGDVLSTYFKLHINPLELELLTKSLFV